MPTAPATTGPDPDELELLVERAPTRSRQASLLFVHGINVGAWVWQQHYLPYFAAAGFDCFAVSLRGHGASAGRERIGEWRMRDYVQDVEHSLNRIEGPVVLVGHSMGGAVVQRYVRQGGTAAGMALLASVPPWGLTPSALHMSLTSPDLLWNLSDLLSGRRPRLDLPAVREALFSPEAPAPLIETFARHAGPESPWIAIDAQGWPPFAAMPWAAPPTFVLGGAADRLIPEGEVQRTGFYYGAETSIIPGLAHALMVEPRWESGARELEVWLRRTCG